jgi:hypothetical protein
MFIAIHLQVVKSVERNAAHSTNRKVLLTLYGYMVVVVGYYKIVQ